MKETEEGERGVREKERRVERERARAFAPACVCLSVCMSFCHVCEREGGGEGGKLVYDSNKVAASVAK